MLESDVQKAVLQFFRSCHEVARIYQNDTQRKRSRKWGSVGKDRPKGLLDLTGYLKGGRAIYWEVKAPGKKPTPEQLEFMAKAKAAGCAVGWGDSLESAQQWICELREGLI